MDYRFTPIWMRSRAHRRIGPACAGKEPERRLPRGNVDHVQGDHRVERRVALPAQYPSAEVERDRRTTCPQNCLFPPFSKRLGDKIFLILAAVRYVIRGRRGNEETVSGALRARVS